jgi:hypothetical protein
MARPGWYVTLPEDFTPSGFVWAVDKTVPTIRSNALAYKESENLKKITAPLRRQTNQIRLHSEIVSLDDFNDTNTMFLAISISRQKHLV